jgi:hypothetical protein
VAGADNPREVAEVFPRWFGPETGEMSSDKAVRVAAGINQARLTHMPRYKCRVVRVVVSLSAKMLPWRMPWAVP